MHIFVLTLICALTVAYADSPCKKFVQDVKDIKTYEYPPCVQRLESKGIKYKEAFDAKLSYEQKQVMLTFLDETDFGALKDMESLNRMAKTEEFKNLIAMIHEVQPSVKTDVHNLVLKIESGDTYERECLLTALQYLHMRGIDLSEGCKQFLTDVLQFLKKLTA